MDRLTVVGLIEEREAVVDALIRLGAIELIPPDKDPGPVAGQPQSAPVMAANTLSRLEAAIKLAQEQHPVRKGLFADKRKISAAAYLAAVGREEAILNRVGQLEHNQARQAELRVRLTRLQARWALLEPWRELPLDLVDKGTEHVQVFLGSVDSTVSLTQLGAQLQEEAPESLVQTLNQDESGVRCLVAVWRERAGAAQALLRHHNFNMLPETGEAGTAAEQLDRIDGQIDAARDELAVLEQDLLELTREGADFEVLHDFLLLRGDRQQVTDDLPATGQTFWLCGWVPAHLTTAVKKGLSSRFVVALQSKAAESNEEYPILFRNHPLVKPYEVIVEMFSPPSTQELDPTPLLAPFFFFFFGLMLSDIGYGLILSVLCVWLLSRVKKEGQMRRMLRMLFLCGISSIIWGVLFGSFFGDVITVLSLDRLKLPALWFNPMDDATLLMTWSMIFGVIHLFTGMGARIWLLFKTGHGLDAILDICPWYLIITGLGLAIGGIGGQTGLILAGAGAAVLLLFGGRDAKNPVMRVVKGLLALYGITGYLSDVLSYTRILALVLATSVIAMVVNLLGFLLGPTILGFLFFVIVAVFGHVMNLALSGLSAYVHTSRLHYVEFFSKFYEGRGRMWQPLKIRTRYVDIERTAADT
jgi:V/A-type H+-transporting ATPase subunit I